jgi:large subunit ribosomal protein L54
MNPDALEPKVPLYEQSVDLPGGDGSVEGSKQAGEARSGLTKAMRDKRRKGIKEDNFLRAMG